MTEDVNSDWFDRMLRGDFAAAWRLADRIPVPAAASLAGKSVLLRCEHGLGDTLHFIRYARLLRPLTRRILAHVQPRLVPLVRRMPEIDYVFTWEQPWPRGQYDCELEIMDLPHVFRTTLETIPADVPYLSIDPELACAACTLYRRPDRRSIGLQLASSDWDPRRSVPPSVLSAVHDIPGLAVFNLEQSPGDPATPDVTATAAAILNLDLVITADTMVAHLAGALAARVWVLLPYDVNWRWMLDREDSPWYPTMRLFRQPDPGDWRTPACRVLEALRLL